MFLRGKKFPSGEYPKQEWIKVVHQVADLAVKDWGMMQVLLDIDADAYFIMILLAFNKSQKQFYFLQSSKSHEQIVENLINQMRRFDKDSFEK